MDKNQSLFAIVCANIVFCSTVVLFFGRNSILRVAACNAPYKEYLVAFLTLGVFYLNVFLLYPGFFLKKRYTLYALFMILSSVTAACIELAFVGPQILPVVKLIPFQKSVHAVMKNYILFLSCRNLAFSILAYFICDIRQQTRMKMEYITRLRQKNHEIPFNKRDGKTEYIDMDRILCCQQARNFSWICMENGQIIKHEGSLVKLGKLLGEENVVRVKKDLLVMRGKIISVDETEIKIQNGTTGKVSPIEYSPSFAKEIMEVLTDHTIGTKGGVEKEQLSKESTFLVQMIKTDKRVGKIYNYVKRHPGCKAYEIKTRDHLSQTTVNRILGQLKKEGLIEYQGSKKYGGYKIVES
ncbi:MAG: winged helix-turn-helix transcriptional regulator [Bacteroidales bacterium]|nr:winged helix-turn-helix transcriptional regulator [Bacteroidales bacterium]